MGIIESEKPCLLVGGGDLWDEDFARARALTSAVVAADGGAAACLSRGVLPDAVIGDFDSLSPEMAARVPAERLHHIREQDSTDFDKCLRNITAPLAIGVGFGGARLDHELAALNVLCRRPERRCVLFGRGGLICLAPPRLSFAARPGEAVSLFPLGPVTGRSQGLHWPINGLQFAPSQQSGTSNRATGPVVLEFDSPHMLLWLEGERLEDLVCALSRQPQGWPREAVCRGEIPRGQSAGDSL